MWTINGTWNDITFTMYNVTYEIGGAGNEGLPSVIGNCAQTYNSQSFGGEWASVFGVGWQAFALKGDCEGTGIEDISADVFSGGGIFEIPCRVSQSYNQTTWGNIKELYR
jgi:hypothetical protein